MLKAVGASRWRVEQGGHWGTEAGVQGDRAWTRGSEPRREADRLITAGER